MDIRKQLNRLARHTLTYGLGRILGKFVSFLLLPVFTTYLTPEDYGISSILGVIVFILTPIFSLGFGAALAPCYYEGNNRERKEATIWTALSILTLSAITLAVLSFLLANQISIVAFQTSQYQYLVRLTLLAISFSILTEPLMLYLQFEERVVTFVILTLMSTLISIGLSILMVVVLRQGVQGLIESNLMGRVATFALFGAVVIPKVKFRLQQAVGRELLRFGIPLIPGFAFMYALVHGNQYILSWFSGLDTVGIYSIGFYIGLSMSLVVSGFQSAWLPFFMSFMERKEEARLLFGRVLTYYTMGVGGLSIILYIIARPVVMVMTQPEFHEAYKVVGLAASAQFLLGVFFILLPGIYFAKEPQLQSVIQGVAVVGAILLNIVLIPLFGLIGAAVALALGVGLVPCLTHLWNYRRRDRYLQVEYQANRILKFFVVYVPFAVLYTWERDFALWGELVLSGLGVILLSFLLYLMLNKGEKQTLRSLIKQVFSRPSTWSASNV